MAMPLVKSCRIDVRVTPDERASMIESAKALGINLSDFVVAAVLEEVARIQRDNPKPKT